MAVHIFPDPHTAPQNVAAGAFTTPVSVINSATAGETGPDNDNSEAGITATSIPATVFVRVSMTGAAAPTVWVQANSGVEKEINAIYPSLISINDGVDATDAAAGTSYAPDADHTYLVKIFVFITGTLNIRIKNNDAAAHDCTYVIANTQALTRQPWIDILPIPLPLGATSNFDALPGQVPAPLAVVQVANKGTGPLSITDALGTAVGGANFTISSNPVDNPPDPMNPGHVPPIAPNAAPLNLKIAFSAPAAVGITNTTYLLNTNDALALTTPGHNRQIALSGATHKLEVMLMLDASGSMAFMPDGNATVPDPNESRWGRMKASARQFLDLLAGLGTGEGRFAIGMFPDITAAGCPVPSPSAADLQVPTDITPTNIATAKTALDSCAPVQNCAATPMGFGIGRAIGTVAGSYGYFDGAANSLNFDKRYLVLMSDGAANSGPPNPPDFYGTGGTSFKGKMIKAITVAYGDTTGTPFEVDHALLSTISTQSAANVSEAATLTLDAGASDLLDLHKAFRTALSIGLSLFPVADPRGTLTSAAPEVRRQVRIVQYDNRAAFVVNWEKMDPERVSVTLITPNCEVITPASAKTDKNIFYSAELNYAIYAFNHDFLSNAADPANPRYGNWTLIISGSGLRKGRDAENYDYEVLTDSRIKMEAATEKAIYYAGNAIKVDASLTLDGLGIPGAAVSLQVTAPGQSVNKWLAFNRVTPQELEKAASLTDRSDPSHIGLKAAALKMKGLTFTAAPHTTTLPMSDPEGKGLYIATFSQTSVPGNYDLYVVADGTTADGVAFHREKRLKLNLDVWPDPKFSYIDTIYSLVDGRPVTMARAILRDSSGNPVLKDTLTNTQIVLTAKGGEFSGRLVDNLDGSYSQVLQMGKGAKPEIGLQFGGERVIPQKAVPNANGLTFMNRVAAFKAGLEAAKGANQHADPKAALGDFTQKSPLAFTSLGGDGMLDLAISGQIIVAKGEDDVTVFIQPDEGLRAYRVEALPVRGAKWVLLGDSAGVSQAFSLEKAKLRQARAIRIIDLSGITRDGNVSPVGTPGVSVLGVAVKEVRSIRKAPKGTDKVDEKKVVALKRATQK